MHKSNLRKRDSLLNSPPPYLFRPLKILSAQQFIPEEKDVRPSHVTSLFPSVHLALYHRCRLPPPRSPHPPPIEEWRPNAVNGEQIGLRAGLKTGAVMQGSALIQVLIGFRRTDGRGAGAAGIEPPLRDERRREFIHSTTVKRRDPK